MITSPANPLVKEVVRLRTRRHRESEQRFVVEGRRPLIVAGAAGIEFQQQIVCPALGGVPIVDAPTVEMAEEAFRKASYRQNPDGVLALASHLDTSLSRLQLSTSALVLVAESIEKPGNLGAMLRTADAAGVDALLLAGSGTDIHNPNVVRASQGALFTVPIAIAPASDLVGWLTDQEVSLVAAVPAGGIVPWGADLTGGIALAVGAEDEGLSDELVGASSLQLSIPMQGEVDSLNASTAAAVLLYEAVRQRTSGA